MRPTGCPRRWWLSLVFKGIEKTGKDLEEGTEQQKKKRTGRFCKPDPY
jgi:hypothetical protein